MRSVAITGIGIVSPLGSNKKELFDNLMAGKSGIRRIRSDFAERLSVKIAAEVDFDPLQHFSKKELLALDRTSQIALIAASRAWEDSGLDLSENEKKRSGTYIGTGMGGSQSVDSALFEIYKKDVSRVSPLFIPKIMSNAPASHISIKYGLTGTCLTFTTACSSSAVAIGEAFRQIKMGYLDIIIAGGVESFITYGSLKCWESLGVLASEDPFNHSASCRPFSNDRSGLVLGEGSAIVILEEMEHAWRRSAEIYGELIGYGSTADAYHIVAPSVEGEAEALRSALKEAKIGIEEIDYINAHGTATIANDRIETQAIKSVFHERAYKIPISSTKSMCGHLMGASGALEFIVAIISMKNNAIPPTAHYRVFDPECDLDYVPNIGRTEVKVKTVISNSFAFGGTNAVLIARKI
jgi:beta-ketoacyl-acyl-carrier-protein synthase II